MNSGHDAVLLDNTTALSPSVVTRKKPRKDVKARNTFYPWKKEGIKSQPIRELELKKYTANILFLELWS
jgi:hypothetical protein